MNHYKKKILDKICYTELVYERINKKLNLELSKDKIEEIIFTIIKETDETGFQQTGKNIYITNYKRNVRLTINSYTNRIITADQLNKIVAKTDMVAIVPKNCLESVIGEGMNCDQNR